MQTSREIYLDACAHIGATLAPHGFKYAKSGPHALRTQGDFTFRISFQSSMRNVVGQYVSLIIHAIAHSKHLYTWRAAQPRPLRMDNWAAGGQVGNLQHPHHWLDFDLADPASRPAIISNAMSTIEQVALPYFTSFDNVPVLCERLVTDDVPGLEGPLALEFLLCFGSKIAAEASFHRFLRARPNILRLYHVELELFRRDGLPSVPRLDYAVQLAVTPLFISLSVVHWDLDLPVAEKWRDDAERRSSSAALVLMGLSRP
jgi:hypothetical protein